MKKFFIVTIGILLLAGFFSPTLAENKHSQFTTNNVFQVETIPSYQNSIEVSSNYYLDTWRSAVDGLPERSMFDYNIKKSAFSVSELSSFVQSAEVYTLSDLELNAPPDPKKKNPINIDDSKDLRKFPGSGTEGDPYVIEGFLFQNSRKNLIQIQNTDVYILIRNNVLNGLNGGNVNILINNANHITVESNTLISNNYGITVSNSNDININSNTISNFVSDGISLNNVLEYELTYNSVSQTSNAIFMSYSNDGDISENTVFSNSGDGVTLSNSHENFISFNTINSNGGDGLFFIDSNRNTVLENTIYDNGFGASSAPNSLNTLSVSSGGTLTIDGSFAGSGFFMDPSFDNIVINNTITDNSGMGLYLEASENTVIDGNTFSSNGLNGIFFEDSHNNVITNNEVTLNGFSGGLSALSLDFWQFVTYGGFASSGFFMDPSDGNTVTDNNFSDNNANGLVLQNSTNTLIYNNTMDDNGLTGLYFEDSNDNQILKNQITGNGDSGLALATMSATNPFELKLMGGFAGSGFFMDPSFNNVVDGNVITGNTGNGLFLLESDNNDVTNNQVTLNGGDGVVITNSSYNDFTSNVVTHNGGVLASQFSSLATDSTGLKVMGGFAGSGFFMDPSEYNVLSGNIVTNNYASGVYFLLSDNSEISDNLIASNGFDGILFEHSDNNNISSNIIEYNGDTGTALAASLQTNGGFTGSGFFMDPSFNNVVSKNNFTGNAAHGFFSEASEHTEFSENRVLDHPLYGVILDSTSADTFIVGNNFDNNNPGASQAADNGLGNQFANNFWSDHDNLDANFDGIADEEYMVDGNSETVDSLASNIPNGLNFYNATMQSSPRVLNADSEGTPITLKVYLNDGFRVLSIELDQLWLNETINPYTSHIIDIQTFTVTFDRLAVNQLVNSLGMEPPFFVEMELTGIINDGLLDITAFDTVEVNQVDESQLEGLLPIAGMIGTIPIARSFKKKKDKRK